MGAKMVRADSVFRQQPVDFILIEDEAPTGRSNSTVFVEAGK